MIRRAIRLRSHLDALKVKFQRQWEDENRGRNGVVRASATLPAFLDEANWLTDTDWVAIGHIERLLTIYEDVLKDLEGDGQVRRRKHGFEGSYGNIWDVFPSYEYLLAQLGQYKDLADSIPDPVQFKAGVNAAWELINKYYTKLDEVYFYYAAYIFHPANRWEAMEKLWESHPASWLTKAKKIVRDRWLAEYRFRPVRSESMSPSPSPSPLSPSRPAKRRKITGLQAFIRQQQQPYPARLSPFDSELANEYDTRNAITDESDMYITDPIAYWHGQRRRSPRLAQMALDTLTIQAMSAVLCQQNPVSWRFVHSR